jgi:hypothetical protein
MDENTDFVLEISICILNINNQFLSVHIDSTKN